MLNCELERFTMHLRYTTLKQLSLRNAQYLPQKAQHSNPRLTFISILMFVHQKNRTQSFLSIFRVQPPPQAELLPHGAKAFMISEL